MEITDKGIGVGAPGHADGESMSTAIALELAAALEQQPTELPPLAETIDTDAIDRLFRNSDADIELTFSHADRRIFVSDAGVTVEPKR